MPLDTELHKSAHKGGDLCDMSLLVRTSFDYAPELKMQSQKPGMAGKVGLHHRKSSCWEKKLTRFSTSKSRDFSPWWQWEQKPSFSLSARDSIPHAHWWRVGCVGELSTLAAKIKAIQSQNPAFFQRWLCGPLSKPLGFSISHISRNTPDKFSRIMTKFLLILSLPYAYDLWKLLSSVSPKVGSPIGAGGGE